MRGKAFLDVMLGERVRITPAYAGKSLSKELYRAQSEDHPCICGEKAAVLNSLAPLLGSPLHMRGKDIVSSETQLERRITPAYAGKRGTNNAWRKHKEDHPCICGEKQAENPL